MVLNPDEEESLADPDWDNKFFGLIIDLETQNALRYERQTEDLLQNRSIKIEIAGRAVKYKISLTGCWCLVAESDNHYFKKSWSRFGYGKASKRKALPHFFAAIEASFHLESQE